MEVAVALAVLAGGVLVFGQILTGVERLRNQERIRVETLKSTVFAIEYVVCNPPPCRDSSYSRKGVEVTVTAVPGVKPLAWVRCVSGGNPQVRLRRLVRCGNKRKFGQN